MIVNHQLAGRLDGLPQVDSFRIHRRVDIVVGGVIQRPLQLEFPLPGAVGVGLRPADLRPVVIYGNGHIGDRGPADEDGRGIGPVRQPDLVACAGGQGRRAQRQQPLPRQQAGADVVLPRLRDRAAQIHGAGRYAVQSGQRPHSLRALRHIEYLRPQHGRRDRYDPFGQADLHGIRARPVGQCEGDAQIGQQPVCRGDLIGRYGNAALLQYSSGQSFDVQFRDGDPRQRRNFTVSDFYRRQRIVPPCGQPQSIEL